MPENSLLLVLAAGCRRCRSAMNGEFGRQSEHSFAFILCSESVARMEDQLRCVVKQNLVRLLQEKQDKFSSSECSLRDQFLDSKFAEKVYLSKCVQYSFLVCNECARFMNLLGSLSRFDNECEPMEVDNTDNQ
jgi:hypothetical protein